MIMEEIILLYILMGINGAMLVAIIYLVIKLTNIEIELLILNQ